MNKENILFVVDEKKMGGVSILLSDILNTINIKNKNIDILVLHNNGNMLKDIPSNVNIIYGTNYFMAIDYSIKEIIKMKQIKLLYHKIQVVLDMKLGFIKKRIKKERKKILNKKYDIEIAFKDGFTALFTAYGNSDKKIHWLHYEYKKINPNGKYNNLFKKTLKLFDEIIAVSDGVMNAFNNIYHLEDKTKVINNLVDVEKIKTKSNEKTDILISSNDINFVSVGRMHQQKGFDRIIKAIKKLNEENQIPSNFKLRFYGDGDQYHYLTKLVKDYNLEQYIQFIGEVSNPYKYIKNNDLFIMSSIYEPFGLVIVEAMTLGIPVLATENHATNKLINNKTNGLIVENSNEGIYNGIKYILNNPKELKKYKNNLKKYKYDNEKIIKQIEEVLTNEKNNSKNV